MSPTCSIYKLLRFLFSCIVYDCEGSEGELLTRLCTQDQLKRQKAQHIKLTKADLERKRGLKNTIKKEKKNLSNLEAQVDMYQKSLAHLEETESKYQIKKQGKKIAKGKTFASPVRYLVQLFWWQRTGSDCGVVLYLTR